MTVITCITCGKPLAVITVPEIPSGQRFSIEKVLSGLGMGKALALLNDPAAIGETFAMRHPECDA